MNSEEESGSVVAFCGRGIVREQNEDNIAIDGEALEHEKIHLLNFDLTVDHLVLVADGMGGHAKGELASQIAVQAIGSVWRSHRQYFAPIEATRAANRAVYEAMATNPVLRGMGATVVGAHICSRKIAWFNLGDSRGYVFRNNILKQFTTDHVPRGATGKGRARSHSITQSVGGGQSLIDVWPAAGVLDMRKHDVFLFCTDGLTDAVPDHSIGRLIEHSNSLLEGATQLIRLAEENGAPDNVSLVLIQV
jgi:serine/threonine protein phosphatase PrpC